MLTKAKLAYDIYSICSGSDRISDDSPIELETIYYKIDTTRAFLIRTDQNKGRSVSDNILQILPCVPVSIIDASSCPCRLPSDCTVLRSTNKIPRFIELYQKDLVTRISGPSIDGIGFSIISFARASRAGSSRWTKNSPKAFLHQGYVYLVNTGPLTNISIEGVFQEPSEASQFANCDGTQCYSDDTSEYPISSHMIGALKDLVLKDLRVELQQSTDLKGDESQVTQKQTP